MKLFTKIIKQGFWCLMIGLALSLANCAGDNEQVEEAIQQEADDESSDVQEEIEQLENEADEEIDQIQEEYGQEDQQEEDQEQEQEEEEETALEPPPSLEEAVNEAMEAEAEAEVNEEVAEAPVEDANVLPAPEPVPQDMESGSRYIVKPGDTLAIIATKIFGSASRWSELASLNNISDPNKIYPGDVINLDQSPEAQTFVQSLSAAPMQQITVVSGDTLSGLAQKHLGRASAWKYIWRFNEDKVPNPDRIEIGQVLNYIGLDFNPVAQVGAEAPPSH